VMETRQSHVETIVVTASEHVEIDEHGLGALVVSTLHFTLCKTMGYPCTAMCDNALRYVKYRTRASCIYSPSAHNVDEPQL
jgi:hypothetical protein